MFCACSFHGNYMNNLLSYCGLIDAKIRASDKVLPVHNFLTLWVMELFIMTVHLPATQCPPTIKPSWLYSPHFKAPIKFRKILSLKLYTFIAFFQQIWPPKTGNLFNILAMELFRITNIWNDSSLHIYVVSSYIKPCWLYSAHCLNPIEFGCYLD